MNGSIYFVFMELKILNYYFLNVCVSIPVFFLLESMIRRRVPFLRNFRNKLIRNFLRCKAHKGFGMWLIVRMQEHSQLAIHFEINSKSKFLLVNLATGWVTPWNIWLDRHLQSLLVEADLTRYCDIFYSSRYRLRSLIHAPLMQKL